MSAAGKESAAPAKTTPAGKNRLRELWDIKSLAADSNDMIADLRRQPVRMDLAIGIFSATTWRPIALYLEGDLLIEGIRPLFEHCEYNALDLGLMAAGPRLDVAVLALDDPGAYPELYDPSVNFGSAEQERVLELWRSRVARARQRARHVYVVLPAPPPPRPYPLARTREGGTISARAARFRAMLESGLATQPGVECIDLEPMILEHGREAFFDARLWELGRIPYSPRGFRALARAFSRRLLHVSGIALKGFILDLDNTLWGGVLGEAGLAGIAIGDNYPGSCYRAFQEEILLYKRCGLLLASASKNNRADALAALDTHPRMALRSQDFDHHEIHWESKVESVRRILRRFNIGADAMLYIDDNPRERLEVAAAFPTLRIFAFPEDPIDLVDSLRAIPWPLFAAATAEDAMRGELAAQQDARQQAEQQSTSRDDYLRSLAAEVTVSIDSRLDLERIADLHKKTNQFNVNPIRISASEIAAAFDDPEKRVVGLRYRDRFGEAGLVACAVARIDGGLLEIETFLLSCRVIGLGVEYALLQALCDAATGLGGAEAAAGPAGLRFTCVRTEKNAPALSFLKTLGYAADESGSFVLDFERVPAVPDWIVMKSDAATESLNTRKDR